jgi:Fe-S cluster biosynthesis and repair protein YggX
MLFDLRSRGRRRTVQAVYLGLAVLMGGGLILFGVGTGSGIGGLLNAFTGSGSNNQSAQISQAEKSAIKATQKDPSNAAAWGALLTARYQNASSVGFDSNTNTYTNVGKQELAKATDAWQRYLTLTKNPTNNLSIVAANAYATLGDYAKESQAWDYATQADATSPKSFECLAISAYAAKQNRTGDLAAAKALSMVPKSTRKTIQQQINTAKTTPALAQTC